MSEMACLQQLCESTVSLVIGLDTWGGIQRWHESLVSNRCSRFRVNASIVDRLFFSRGANTDLPDAHYHDNTRILSGIATFASTLPARHSCARSAVLRMEPRPLSWNDAGA